MKFEKNDLLIKDVPFDFKGEFNFRKDGYSLFLSLFSMFGKEYVSGSVYMVSTDRLWLSVKTDVNLDLQSWSRAFGVTGYDLRGMFSMRMKALGEYATGPGPDGSLRDPVITSIPDITLSSKLTGGYLRIGQLPQAISGISFDLSAATAGHDYRSLDVKLENFRAAFMNNKAEGWFRLKGLTDFPVEGHLATTVNLAELRNVIPLDSLDLRGKLDVSMDVKGNYAPEKKLFPETKLSLSLNNGFLKTTYSPVPLENIELGAMVTNATGELSGTSVVIDPLSFTFEGNPFQLKARLDNPADLGYDITAHGSVDVGKVWRLFAQEGMDLDGFVSMNMVLKGRQSDAMAGQFDRLLNKGRLELRDIAFRSGYLPLPLVVREGVFRFDNDDIRFEKFSGTYGASDIAMEGHLSNVVNYVLTENQTLKGSFTFTSGYLAADEFMAPVVETEPVESVDADTSQPAAVPGVIVVPSNLEVGLKADVRKLSFRGVEINDLHAAVEVQQGLLLLKDMHFGIIGCRVAMDATYGSVTPEKAFFDFHVRADSFDIRRAYNEIELFRNLSTSAGKCEGIVSLEYTLKGRLDAGMNPIYPSLEGNGTVTLEKIRVMGLKLFTAMGKNLDREQIGNPDLSKVELKTSIRKNVITLERTRMRVSGFRFRIGGETNFNGQLNFKARLGLPPMGIVGIPMRILGTQDDPKFKYGRGTKDEDVEETDYTDELSPEMLKLIRNAKAEDLKDEPQ